MSRNSFMVAIAAIAVAVGTGSRAEAGLRVGIQGDTGIPVGDNSDIGSPSVAGRLRLQWALLDDNLVVGAVGGYERGTFDSSASAATSSSATLSTTLVGVSAQRMFAPPDWDSRPFVGLEAGYTRFSLAGGVFNPPFNSTTSQGWFLTPRLGLFSPLGRHVALEFAFHYQFMHVNDDMAIADRQTQAVSELGMELGVIFRL
jgi:hypothetical protein